MNDTGHNTHNADGSRNTLIERSGSSAATGAVVRTTNGAGDLHHPAGTAPSHSLQLYNEYHRDAEVDQFANAIYPQYVASGSGSGTGPIPLSYYDPNASHSLQGSIHNSDDLYFNPSDTGDTNLDYFTYSSFLVPSSRIDHLYPSVPISVSLYGSETGGLQPQHLGASQEVYIQRPASNSNSLQVPLTPPVPKPKGVKMLQKPGKLTKPKTVRQNSFPIVSKSKVTKSYPQSVTPSHEVKQSYFEFDHIADYDQYRTDVGAMSGKSTPLTEVPVLQTYNDNDYKNFRDTTPTSSSHAKASPRPRGRAQNSKNPGFFIKLDNINRVTHSNASVDSLFLNKNSVVSSQKFSPLPNYKDDEDVRRDLTILDPDIGTYDGSELQRFSSANSNMTPSMKPPGTNQNSYFEVDNPAFLSPHINYKDSNLNNFNKGFEEYLQDEYPPELNGYNFDVNPAEMLLSPLDLLKPDLEPVDLKKELESDHDDIGKHQDFESTSSVSSPDVPIERTSSHSSTSSREKPKKKRNPKGAICSICNKHISRDLTRHLRIHNEVGRFQCVYPKEMCNHKTQHFNRPYDYKKHLLHVHFKFDDPKGKLSHTLTDKLPLSGTCVACGTRFRAKEWLDTHVLTESALRCPHLKGLTNDSE